MRGTSARDRCPLQQIYIYNARRIKIGPSSGGRGVREWCTAAGYSRNSAPAPPEQHASVIRLLLLLLLLLFARTATICPSVTCSHNARRPYVRVTASRGLVAFVYDRTGRQSRGCTRADTAGNRLAFINAITGSAPAESAAVNLP